jgi:hypothetical protein
LAITDLSVSSSTQGGRGRGAKGGGSGSDAAWAPASADSSSGNSSAGSVGGRIWELDEHVQRDFDAAALAAAARHGWRVMVAWALTRPAAAWLEGDYLQYLGYVYEELNDYLLNMIC